jgi:hypothetical protein
MHKMHAYAYVINLIFYLFCIDVVFCLLSIIQYAQSKNGVAVVWLTVGGRGLFSIYYKKN